MNRKIIQRKWALVTAILVTLASVGQLAGGFDTTDSYEVGRLIGTIAIPALFFILAFKRKKTKIEEET